LIVTCFLLTFQVNARQIFYDSGSYNPCVSGSGVYFYPDPTNPHRYYQCDASGRFYIQTCASDLVWDDLITACNYASAVAPAAPSSGGAAVPFSSSGGSQTPPDDSSETPPSATPAAISSSGGSHSSSSGGSGPQIAFPSPAPDVTPAPAPAQTPSPSVSSSSSSSLCKPVNPCGTHGECIESPATSSNKRRRFACICEEDCFGRLCDKQSSGFSTPSPRTHLDQLIYKKPETATFSLPVLTDKDSKYIFYGLNGNNKVEPMSHLNKRMMDSESGQEFD